MKRNRSSQGRSPSHAPAAPTVLTATDLIDVVGCDVYLQYPRGSNNSGSGGTGSGG